MTTQPIHLEVQLPWPDRKLSPNARLHWSTVSKAKKVYRKNCWACTLLQLPKLLAGPLSIYDGDFDVTMTFSPPDKRRYDRDNLVARMKSGLDGVAEALHINDHRFRWVAGCIGPGEPGTVRVAIHAAAAPSASFQSNP